MCGICGIYNINFQPINKEHLLKMGKLIHHRGPDDEGYMLVNSQDNIIKHCHAEDTIIEYKSTLPYILEDFNANLGMGFRRLSIIDLSPAGHQPMADLQKKCWIVFNGEIYNYQEIKNELIALGYTFRSETDTEVIINAYLQWGKNCVSRFNGMFAIALWDIEKQLLFCARDRMGVKPFYYHFDGKKFVWASELKQFIKSGVVEPRVNYANIHNYLMMSRLNVDKNTFFEEIVELPPAHTMEVSAAGIQIERYWDINEKNLTLNLSDEDYAKGFEELFADSVRLRLRSDVPLGIALSGGLDSSSIACIAGRFVSNPIKTFSVYYEDDKKFDEREYISEVLKVGNFDPVYFTANQNVSFDELTKFFYHQDEPCMSASPFSAYKNNQNIRNAGIIVALNGQGGDELLAGYHTYFKYYYLDLMKNLKFSKLYNEFRLYQKQFNLPSNEAVKLFSKIGLRLFLSDKFLKQFEYKEIANEGFYSHQLSNFKNPMDLGQKYKDELSNNLYQTLVNTSIPHLLHWEDRNSMAHSIESRVPFLDYRLVEWIFSIPTEQKIRGAETKFVLRNAMKNILPEKVRTRMDKVGFATPTDLWTSKILKNEIKDIFSSTSFKQRGIFDADKIETAYNKSPGSFKSNEIWRILSMEMWFRIFIDNKQ
ncbi:MAG: asparagine synthase (glutamine-hydrolyzing) [Bacteroidetes bacterium]|nr:asparagine synthase (glutamine-hydrolyzing) [Bacteroidota bacterium]